MSTPQDKIIEQLESDVERLKRENSELKDEIKILGNVLKNTAGELKKLESGYFGKFFLDRLF